VERNHMNTMEVNKKEMDKSNNTHLQENNNNIKVERDNTTRESERLIK